MSINCSNSSFAIRSPLRWWDAGPATHAIVWTSRHPWSFSLSSLLHPFFNPFTISLDNNYNNPRFYASTIVACPFLVSFSFLWINWLDLAECTASRTTSKYHGTLVIVAGPLRFCRLFTSVRWLFDFALTTVIWRILLSIPAADGDSLDVFRWSIHSTVIFFVSESPDLSTILTVQICSMSGCPQGTYVQCLYSYCI